MFQIVASDLDGTLLSPEHRLTPHAHDTLRQLVDRNIHFVFATGRHYVDVAQIRDKLAIPAYMITSNGARVHNEHGELVFSHNIDNDIAQELYHLEYANPHIITHVYRNDDWLISRESPEEKKYFCESVFKYQVYEPDAQLGEGISKIFFTCNDPQQLIPLELALRARWGDRINISFSLPTCLELMAGGVSKGHALEAVAKQLGHSLEACVAFGDGMNDVEMLSMAGRGYIMRNAYVRLKETLPELEVIGSNAEDAVPNQLRSMFFA